MAFPKRFFDFYLQSSFHVALACMALAWITREMYGYSGLSPVLPFVFCGTVAGYNFVKYDALARQSNTQPGRRVKAIAVLSFFALLGAGWFFLQMKPAAQISCGLFALLTVLYTLPFFPNRSNARNWAGVKIYIVSLCWAGVTVVLPLLDASGFSLFLSGLDPWLKSLQRFLLVFVLVLVFEIIDLTKDDPHLQTVPQQIGIRRTKILGLLLLIPFYLLELMQHRADAARLWINLAMVAVLAGFLVGAKESRSRYYTAFWAESVPLFWGLLFWLFG